MRCHESWHGIIRINYASDEFVLELYIFIQETLRERRTSDLVAQLVQTKNRIFETDIWCKSWDKNRQHPFRSFCLIHVFKICLHWKSPLYTCALISLIFSQKQQVQATLAYNSIPVNLDSYQPLGVWQALLGGAHLNGICSTLGIHNGFHHRFGSSTPELLRLTSYQSISWCHGVWTYITILWSYDMC